MPETVTKISWRYLIHAGEVLVVFDQEVTHLALTPDKAREVAAQLQKIADAADPPPAKQN